MVNQRYNGMKALRTPQELWDAKQAGFVIMYLRFENGKAFRSRANECSSFDQIYHALPMLGKVGVYYGVKISEPSETVKGIVKIAPVEKDDYWMVTCIIECIIIVGMAGFIGYLLLTRSLN